jgi:hypothetical protein
MVSSFPLALGLVRLRLPGDTGLATPLRLRQLRGIGARRCPCYVSTHPKCLNSPKTLAIRQLLHARFIVLNVSHFGQHLGDLILQL